MPDDNLNKNDDSINVQGNTSLTQDQNLGGFTSSKDSSSSSQTSDIQDSTLQPEGKSDPLGVDMNTTGQPSSSLSSSQDATNDNLNTSTSTQGSQINTSADTKTTRIGLTQDNKDTVEENTSSFTPKSPFGQSSSLSSSDSGNSSLFGQDSQKTTSDKDNDGPPIIVPGIPGNQIKPPDEEPKTSTIENVQSSESPPSVFPNMVSPASSENMSSLQSSSSGQPLNTGLDQKDEKPADFSKEPLKSPPMPGFVEAAEQAPSDDNENKSSPPSPSAVISTSDSGSGSKFKFFVILLIVITIIVYGVVAYLYFTGDSDESSESNVTGSNLAQNTNPKATETVPSSTPTPKITETITINNGDVVSESSIGDITVLVKKNDYPETGIVGFSKVNQSPDKQKLCFYSLSPADDPSLYISESDGSNVEKIVSDVSSCFWSNDSSKIAYTNTPGGTSTVDIFTYEISTAESVNLTSQDTADSIFRIYEIESWSDDDSKIKCNYTQLDSQNTNQEILGQCEVDIASEEVLDL